MGRLTDMSLGGSERRRWNLWVLYQLHNPVLPTPPHLFPYVSAQDFKVVTLESLAWVLVHTLVLTRIMNWTKVPTTQFLYSLFLIELFEGLEISYTVPSTVPGT